MKNINLNKSSDLLKVKNELNSVFESRIKAAELNEAIENFSNLSLGDLNHIFESVSDRLFDSANGKKIIGKYVKALKENKELGKAFAIYHVVNNPKHVGDVNLFLSETFALSNDINKARLQEGKDTLSKIVAEAVKECNLTAEQINETVSESRQVNEAIEYLLSNKRSAKNIYEHVNSLTTLKEHVSVNAEAACEGSNQSVKELSEELLSTLNEGELDKWEHDAIWGIVSANLSNRSRAELFEEYKKNCVNKIDEILNEQEDVAEKSRLTTMKQQLEGKKFSEETLTEDILNLSKLYHTLSE